MTCKCFQEQLVVFAVRCTANMGSKLNLSIGPQLIIRKLELYVEQDYIVELLSVHF